MERVRLEITLWVDPENLEELDRVAVELEAALDPVRHRALLELARAMCRRSGDLGQLIVVRE